MGRDKEKHKEYCKEWRLKNKEKRWSHNKANKDKYKKQRYLYDYKLATEVDYQHYLDTTHCECCGAMLETSGKRTAKTKCQDHDHVTGELRGVICHTCNMIEGLIRDTDHFNAIGQYLLQIKHKQ